ncbi:hypothetical protein TTHERM_00678500 (macronuclear) [Tetrahymena thermophila SB210]|uniref:Uncharacterized protein n=1 Tax=Tetrahymena thermophila (strain SB210) TaxID=312017 RepID=I7MJX2_TETTS|nr:hypothetical protein TTHERM_00678500 [Tetrahymena thermophila SB210]EAS07584.1 hypothetical protein TTHERM_00678500 [Tetrahymena thermophila SB210]|eukprot:XP_001027826.1 hypothetical protein TTHERM_00678500 [Tetrahymena thermophila SB210]
MKKQSTLKNENLKLIEAKKKIFQDYTKVSQLNKQHVVQNQQLKGSKLQNQKVILQQFSLQKDLNKEQVQKKQSVQNCLDIQIQKNYILNLQKSIKVHQNSQLQLQKTKNKIQISQLNSLQKENKKYEVMPCLAIQGKKKEMQLQVLKRENKKQDLEKEKSQVKEEKKNLISGDNLKVESQLLQQAYESNPCINQLNNKCEKRKEGFVDVKIQIKNYHDQSIKLNQLHNQIKETNKLISLKLDTTFENYQSLLNFCVKFLKFGSDLIHLEWHVKGYFNEYRQSNLISELISRFFILTKFVFVIHLPYISTLTVESFSNGLKQLKNLKIFHFKVSKPFQSNYKQGMRDKAHLHIINAVQNLENLEIMVSDVQQIQHCSPPPSKMANLIYSYNLPDRVLKQKQQQNLKIQSQKITMLQLNNVISAHLYSYNSYQCQQDTLKLFDLPFVTSCYFTRDSCPHQVEVSQIINHLRKFVSTKMRHLLQIISFHKQITEFIPLNPAMLMTDLWFD